MRPIKHHADVAGGTASGIVRALLLSLLLLVCCQSLLGAQPALPEQLNEGSLAGPTSAAEWKRQLRAWLKVLREAHRTGDDSADDLKERIRKIRDPNALAGLEAVVSEGRDYPRLYFLEPLAKIGGPRAMKTLVEVCATDTNISVQEAVPEFIKFLRAPSHTGAAAEGLSASGLAQQFSTTEAPDPALTNALINALISIQIKRVVIGGRGFSISYGIGKGVGTPPRVWAPRLVRYELAVPHAAVLNTLVKYTGENYGYDQAAWRKWYETRKRAVRRHD